MESSIDKLREAMRLSPMKNSPSKKEHSAVSEDWKAFQLTQQQMMEDLSRQKDEIFKESVKQLGLEMYLKEEEGRRFKRFMRVIEGDKETIYFNDGSINGLRIITFVTSPEPLKLENNCCCLAAKMTYF